MVKGANGKWSNEEESGRSEGVAALGAGGGGRQRGDRVAAVGAEARIGRGAGCGERGREGEERWDPEWEDDFEAEGGPGRGGGREGNRGELPEGAVVGVEEEVEGLGEGGEALDIEGATVEGDFQAAGEGECEAEVGGEGDEEKAGEEHAAGKKAEGSPGDGAWGAHGERERI